MADSVADPDITDLCIQCLAVLGQDNSARDTHDGSRATVSCGAQRTLRSEFRSLVSASLRLASFTVTIGSVLLGGPLVLARTRAISDDLRQRRGLLDYACNDDRLGGMAVEQLIGRCI